MQSYIKIILILSQLSIINKTILFFKMIIIPQYLTVQLQMNNKVMRIVLNQFIQTVNQLNNYNLALPTTLINILEEYHISTVKKQQQHIFFRLLSIQLSLLQTRTIYNAIKWLILTHKVIQQFHGKSYQPLLSKMFDLLEDITCPVSQTNRFESYLTRKMFNSYRQYLKKIAQIYLLDLQNRTNVQYIQMSKQNIYCQYNLLTYTIAQFQPIVTQFSPFFIDKYPLLSSYTHLIAKDIQHILYSIRSDLEQQSLNVSFIQVEILQAKLKIFSIENSSDKVLDKLQPKTEDHSGTNQRKNNYPQHSSYVTPFQNQQENTNLQLLQKLK